MIFIKKHAAEHGIILAMCDEELLGKVLKAGKLVLDLDKYASFYNGELVSDEQAFGMVDSGELYTANVVGERSTGIMVKKGIVTKDDIKKIGKVPFVQVYKLDV